MLGVITGFAIIFAIIFTGYGLSKAGAIRNDHERLVLNRVAFYAASPCLLFSTVSKTDPSTLISPVILVVFLATVLTSAVYLVASRAFFKQDIATSAMGAAASSYFNSVNIGLPVSIYVIGEAGYVAPTLVLQMVIITPIVLAFLSPNPRQVGAAVRSALLSPVFLGSSLGLMVCLAGWELPDPVMKPMEMIGGASIPLVLISFGASLTTTSILREHAVGTMVASGLKLLAMPAVAWGLSVAMGLGGTQLYAAIVLAALPTAQNVYNYAATYQKGETIARDTVFVTTFLSLPVMLLIALIFGG